MAEITPLTGIRYTKKAGAFTDVIAPPYDVISGEEEKKLHSQSPYNIIRLEKPAGVPGEVETAKYARAKDQYQSWLNDGVLSQEEEPALYYYQQHFEYETGRHVREGLMCGVKLEPYANKVVIPHEETLDKPKADRLHLLRICRANFSPIFSLYSDPERSIAKLMAPYKEAKPALDFTDHGGQTHKLWAVADKEIIAKVQGLLKDKQLFIADGHHRYETALAYQQEQGEAEGKQAFVLMTLVNLYDPGLMVLPTHRMVRGSKNFSTQNFVSHLEDLFLVKEYPFTPEDICREGIEILKETGERNTAFGLFTTDKRFFILTKKADREGQDVLDTAILQGDILEKKLGIDAAKRAAGEHLSYTRSCSEAVGQVLSGDCQMSFLLNPTPADVVTAVAAKGVKMPQKSTFFYPKLSAGLVINPLE